MTERVKLKRGLSDISPLFTRVETDHYSRARIVAPTISDPVSVISATPEICYIWSVDDEGDSHFLNNFFASKMVKPDATALLLTLEAQETKTKSSGPEPWNRSLRRMCLPAARVQEAFRDSSRSFQPNFDKSDTQIYLEMSMESLLGQPELVRILDHVVLFLKPNVESVTETYRQLKKLAALELRAEVTVLFDANNAGGLPSRLYELFSDFVSRNLSFSINFLGTLHLSHGAESLQQDICWKSWSQSHSARPEVIEKMHFLAWIEALKCEEVRK